MSRARPRGSRRKLRVCMVHFSDFVLDSRVQRHARSLAALGHEVHCVCLDGPGRFVEGDGVIHTYAVGEPSGKPRAGVLNYIRAYARFLKGASTRISALQHLHRLDLVQVHNMPNLLTYAALPTKLQGVPLLLDMHDTFPELFATKFGLPSEHPLKAAIRGEERASAAIADRILVVTNEAHELIAGRGVGVGKTQVVMNSPDERVFGPRRRPLLPPADDPLRIVYHGGMAERFGVETLIHATSTMNGELDGGRVDIFSGCPVEGARIKALARKVAPGSVNVFDKPTPFAEIPSRLSGAHIGVVPTLRDTFTELLLPVKLLEYVHLGIPVVTSRLPAIERYFRPDEVTFFEPGSPTSLARAIRDVASHRDATIEKAGRASERLKSFEWPLQRQTYLAVVEELTGATLAAP
jgi:glycosyltransferase involved in cell wall biosynthesis